MITANEARSLTNAKLSPVETSPEFKQIMDRIETEIREAIANGLESIQIKGYCLPVYNNYKYPKGLNSNAIDRETFWVKYVRAELEKNGFKVCNTLTSNTYAIHW